MTALLSSSIYSTIGQCLPPLCCEYSYWQTAAEAKGESPFKDPLAIIGIASILLPFIILGVAIASGYLDLSPYQYPHH